jgi:hypothetical protein
VNTPSKVCSPFERLKRRHPVPVLRIVPALEVGRTLRSWAHQATAVFREQAGDGGCEAEDVAQLAMASAEALGGTEASEAGTARLNDAEN